MFLKPPIKEGQAKLSTGQCHLYYLCEAKYKIVNLVHRLRHFTQIIKSLCCTIIIRTNFNAHKRHVAIMTVAKKVAPPSIKFIQK
jgi:hypothetical protein